jgi:hypothetical protein
MPGEEKAIRAGLDGFFYFEAVWPPMATTSGHRWGKGLALRQLTSGRSLGAG